MLKQGLIQVYTSQSKKLNYAPLGLSLRAAGHGLRIFIAGFGCGELIKKVLIAAEYLGPHMTAVSVDPESPGAFQDLRNQTLEGHFDMVILLEALQALGKGRFSEDDLLTLMDEKPDRTELVLSGRGASDRILKKADLVTEMHYREKEAENAGLQGKDEKATSSVITGNGKGKTTYCLGKAMIKACEGSPSVIIQFIKSPRAYGEVKAIERLPLIDLKTMGQGFLDKQTKAEKNPSKKHLQAAKLAWEEALQTIFSSEYRLAVLDEINIATHYGLTNAGRVRETIFLKPDPLQLILSGRNADPEVMEQAAGVIEMKEIKHPYKRGIKARKGIEF